MRRPGELPRPEQGAGGPAHVRPMLWLAVALAAGVILAGWVRPHPFLPLGVLWGALAGACLHRRGALAWVLLAALAAGAWRYSHLRHGGPGALAAWLDRPVELAGTAREVRAEGGRWRALLYVDTMRAPGGQWAPASGVVWVAWRRPGSDPAAPWPGGLPGEGERVQAAGVLATPPGARGPGEFDHREYLARRGVFWSLTAPEPPQAVGAGQEPRLLRWGRLARDHLDATLQAYLDPAGAALLSGLVLGTRAGIPAQWQTAFRVTGIYHILAASGANVALVVLPFLWALTRLGVPRRLRSLAALPVLGAYWLLAGAGPPVTRAALMAGLALGGEALDRRAEPYNSVGAAAIVILLAAPGQLYDLGFQLSFAATLGILALAAPLQAALERVLVRPVATGLAVTMAAGAAVEPLLWATFGYVAASSPLANLLVAPVLAVLVPLGLGAMLLGAVWLPAALPLLAVCRALLYWLVQPVAWLALAPGAYLPLGALPALWAVPWYLALAAWRWWPWWRRRAVGIWSLAAAWRQQRAAWRRAAPRPWRRRVLAGAALAGAALALVFARVVPSAGGGDVTVGGAAPSAGGVPGTAVPASGTVLLAAGPDGEAELVLPGGAWLPVQPHRPPPPGVVAPGPGLWRVELGEVALLLAGALDSRDQRGALGREEALRAAVLLAPPALLPEFLTAVKPQVVVFATAPQPGVAVYLAAAGIRVLRTDRHGPVQVLSNGRTIWLEAAHPPPELAAGRWLRTW